VPPAAYVPNSTSGCPNLFDLATPVPPPAVSIPMPVPAAPLPLPSEGIVNDTRYYNYGNGAFSPIPLPSSRIVNDGAKLPTPAVPSRSIPQGVNADGSKANLPLLPEDEMEDALDDSESAEPRPSPQTKKPSKPKPASDERAAKATFTQPRSSTVFLPSVFLPGASVGFQFLLPIRPLSLRLPFNQRLEIEIFGRVVPDTRASDGAK
jgi:hypothetical protein